MNTSKLDVILYNNYGDQQKILNHLHQNLYWEYNSIGGCGQAMLEIAISDDDYAYKIRPESSIKIFIDGQVRYHGKILRVNRIVQTGSEIIKLTVYGYIIELQTYITTRSYTGQGIDTIVKDILDNDVLPYSKITYSSSDIDPMDYSIESIDFNHTVQDAMSFLADIAGNIEWGVDRNRKFFFKKRDYNIKNVFVLGRELTYIEEERQDDKVINTLNVYGGDNEFLSTLTSSLSISRYGKKEANLYESSITAFSDANRLSIATLQAQASPIRSVKFSIQKPDIFLEQSLPIGGIAWTKSPIRTRPKYGHTNKYGHNVRYGNLKRDQLQNVQYSFVGGGMIATGNLQDDLSNLGDIQKRAEFEIKDLQRR